MKYNGKDITSEEALALLAEKDKQIKELEEAKEAPAEEAPKEEAPAEEAPKEEAPKEETPAEEAPKEEASAEEAPKQASDPKADKKLSEKEEENRKLNERIVALEEDKRKSTVEAKLSEYKAKGIAPVVIEAAKKYALCDTGAQSTYRLSEDGKERNISLTDAIFGMLDTVSGIELGELSDTTPSGSSDIEASEQASKDRNEKIKKYQDEHPGLSFYEAYSALQKEGKIEAVKVVT